VPGMVATMRKQLKEARAELARIYLLPEFEWAQVTSTIMRILASSAKAGFPVNETEAVAVLDKGQTYVNRLRRRVKDIQVLVDTACTLGGGIRSGWVEQDHNGGTWILVPKHWLEELLAFRTKKSK